MALACIAAPLLQYPQDKTNQLQEHLINRVNMCVIQSNYRSSYKIMCFWLHGRRYKCQKAPKAATLGKTRWWQHHTVEKYM